MAFFRMSEMGKIADGINIYKCIIYIYAEAAKIRNQIWLIEMNIFGIFLFRGGSLITFSGGHALL